MGHEERTKDLFRSIALERQGYYDSAPGGRPRLSYGQRRVRRIVERVLDARLQRLPALRRLLDAGCGRGDFTIQLGTRYPDLTELFGCDFSPELLELARSNAAGLSRIAFSVGDLTALPFAAAQVDLTLCLNVLHHIPHERVGLALDELARVTTRTLVVEIKNASCPYFRMHSKLVEGVPIFPVTVEQVEEPLRASGFALVRAHAIFGWAWLSPLIVLHFERVSSA